MNRRLLLFAGLGVAIAMVMAEPAVAQTFTLDFGKSDAGSATSRVIQLLLLMTVLSVAPAIIMMLTAFTRIVTAPSPAVK